jgi:hypothetical protein
LFNFGVYHKLLPSLLVLLKVYRKILVSFGLVQNFEILDLAIAKVEKANITVTNAIYSLFQE